MKYALSYALVLAILLCSVSDQAFARKHRVRYITGYNGSTTVTDADVVVNTGTIDGGDTTGLTVEGATTVYNSGTITGTTGLSTDSSTVINTGTISGFSSSYSVGVYQVP
jgi:hypothetical protein